MEAVGQTTYECVYRYIREMLLTVCYCDVESDTLFGVAGHELI